ncbi:MAG: hypothetical protein WBE26_16465 [Phycisphaerae bacterium]
MCLCRFKPDRFGALRKRMIAETELALLVGLRFPERVPRIPRVEVGKGTFHPEFAAQFWSETLGIDVIEFASLSRHPQNAHGVSWRGSCQQIEARYPAESVGHIGCPVHSSACRRKLIPRERRRYRG